MNTLAQPGGGALSVNSALPHLLAPPGGPPSTAGAPSRLVNNLASWCRSKDSVGRVSFPLSQVEK